MKTLIALPLINCFVDAVLIDERQGLEAYTITGKQLAAGIAFILKNTGEKFMWNPFVEDEMRR